MIKITNANEYTFLIYKNIPKKVLYNNVNYCCVFKTNKYDWVMSSTPQKVLHMVLFYVVNGDIKF